MSVVEISDDRPKTIDELLEEWNLTIRTFNVLKREGVTTLDRLTFLTEDKLWEMRNLGAKGVEEIITRLHEHGYKLAGYNPWREVIIPGLREGYQASREGVIRSPKGHELKPSVRTGKRGGRVYISVMVDDRSTVLPLDVMVLSAYYGWQENQEPLYRDGDMTNCRLENLSWSEQPVVKKGRSVRRQINGDVPTIRKGSVVNTPARGNDVEVYRTYISGEVTAAVSDDGSGMVSVGGTTLSLTAHQLVSLTKVASRIAEVNALMGIG